MRTTCLILFFLLLFACSYVFQGGGWNQGSRFALLYSIVDNQTLAIDDYISFTRDRSYFKGHFYSDKAPGTALLALPAFYVAKFVTENFYELSYGSRKGKIRRKAYRSTIWHTTVLFNGILFSITGVITFLVLKIFFSPLVSMITTCSIFLGTHIFPYSTVLFSHCSTIAFLSISLFSVLLSTRNKNTLYLVIAGLFAGFAVIGEYPAVIGVFGLCIFLFINGTRHRVFLFIASMSPALIILCLYNYLVFDSVFKISYSSVVGFGGMREGFFGITFPKLKVLYALTFSQYRGLFFWSPILLLCVPGFYYMFKDRVFSALSLVSLFVFIAYLLFASSYYYWAGGTGFGPRHLSGALPFLILPLAFGIQKLPYTSILLACASILSMSIVTLYSMQVPLHVPELIDVYVRNIIESKMRMNLGQIIGLQGEISVLLYVLIFAMALPILYVRSFKEE